jgi:hypothetical protein
MAGTINLAEKYWPLLEERFSHESFTNEAAGTDFDWDGVNSIKVYTDDQVTINKYDRTAAGNRFGTVQELGDTVQTMVLTQDNSFTFSIDEGNAKDQFNIKSANRKLKTTWDEQIVPLIDQYRLKAWATGGGLTGSGTKAPTKDNILELIMNGNAAMSNELVPMKNRFLFISNTLFVTAKLSTQVIGSDSMATEAFKNGKRGYLDGVPVIAVPDSYLPTGVSFMIKYKQATADPIKMKTLRVQKHPLGYDGDVGEGRVRFDSFVRETKKNGIYTYKVSA